MMLPWAHQIHLCVHYPATTAQLTRVITIERGLENQNYKGKKSQLYWLR